MYWQSADWGACQVSCVFTGNTGTCPVCSGVMSDPLLMASISRDELPGIYEEAFQRYVIDESHMFRYAKRRTADKRIKQFIHEKTTVKLRIS